MLSPGSVQFTSNLAKREPEMAWRSAGQASGERRVKIAISDRDLAHGTYREHAVQEQQHRLGKQIEDGVLFRVLTEFRYRACRQSWITLSVVI